MDARLPAALEVSALVRRINGEGGFATVLAKGDADAGAILLVLVEHGRRPRLWERVPQASGSRAWQCVRENENDTDQEVNEILQRRRANDPDLWIVELDIPNAERFVG